MKDELREQVRNEVLELFASNHELLEWYGDKFENLDKELSKVEDILWKLYENL